MFLILSVIDSLDGREVVTVFLAFGFSLSTSLCFGSVKYTVYVLKMVISKILS